MRTIRILALQLIVASGVAIAPVAAHAVTPVEHRAFTTATGAPEAADADEMQELAEREAAANQLENFEGGDPVLVIGGTTLLLILLVVLLVVLLM